jgi:hypothetical protein
MFCCEIDAQPDFTYYYFYHSPTIPSNAQEAPIQIPKSSEEIDVSVSGGEDDGQGTTRS